MATTTAIILIGHAHQNSSGIVPSHIIRLTENDRPALILNSIHENMESKVIIPTIADTVNDIYLMIAVYILKMVIPSKDIDNLNRDSLHEILEDNERRLLYAETFKVIQENRIKVVFNILDDSILLTQLDIIKNYPNDFEVTLPAMKKELNAWSNEIITMGL